MDVEQMVPGTHTKHLGVAPRWAASCVFLAAASLFAGIAHAEFDPKTGVSACVLWLDAASVDSTSIAQWADLSGLGNSALQDDAELQPELRGASIGGKPAVWFDGDDMLATPLSMDWSNTDWTVFAVACLESDTPNDWRGIVGNRFGEGAANWWTLGTKSDGTLYLEFSPGHGVNTSLAVREAGPQIYAISKREDGFELLRNGRTTGSFIQDNVGGRTNTLCIGRWYGAGQGWRGGIGEV
ncbi:MAG: hypothetical protein QG656_254, partial [Candidatus Hydrogenedentes bacterium]|nr:hypothetical protein [Candidatus Hydrogenedentota bacterium]